VFFGRLKIIASKDKQPGIHKECGLFVPKQESKQKAESQRPSRKFGGILLSA